jgi:phosphate transport system substrate-binding protein
LNPHPRKKLWFTLVQIDINNNGIIDSTENFYDSLADLLNAVSSGLYPSPPARELYFVSKGKPSKQSVKDFIQWALNDGQKYVMEAGYVLLDQEELRNQLNKLL